MVDGNDCSGCSAPTRTPVRRSSKRSRTRRGPASRRDARRARRARSPVRRSISTCSIARSGVATITSAAPRATSETSAGRDARHAAADGGRRRVGRAAADRRRPSNPVPSDRARSSFPRGPGRSGRRCAVVPPWKTQCYRRLAHALPRRRRGVGPTSAGATSRSGARTNPRSHMRGCGSVRSGSSSRTSSYSSRSTSSVRGPHRSRPHPVRVAFDALREREQRVRRRASVSIATTAFRNASCGGPPTGAVSYTRETLEHLDAGCRRERVDRELEIARRGRRDSNPARAMDTVGSPTSPLDAHGDVAEQRAYRRMHLADLDDRADHARIGSAHLGDARREPLQQSVLLRRDDPAHGLAHRGVVDGVLRDRRSPRRRSRRRAARRRPRTVAGGPVPRGAHRARPTRAMPEMRMRSTARR